LKAQLASLRSHGYEPTRSEGQLGITLRDGGWISLEQPRAPSRAPLDWQIQERNYIDGLAPQERLILRGQHAEDVHGGIRNDLEQIAASTREQIVSQDQRSITLPKPAEDKPQKTLDAARECLKYISEEPLNHGTAPQHVRNIYEAASSLIWIADAISSNSEYLLGFKREEISTNAIRQLSRYISFLSATLEHGGDVVPQPFKPRRYGCKGFVVRTYEKLSRSPDRFPLCNVGVGWSQAPCSISAQTFSRDLVVLGHNPLFSLIHHVFPRERACSRPETPMLPT
jgi:hypothetical protein